jgi:uncharacterized protein (TIGR03000 family)
MTRTTLAVVLTTALASSPADAGWLFPKGVGNYGPYTGGHGYSYATAYHYGFAWSAADTWNRDIFAYPAGISPYRPYGKPISKTVFPHPETPYIAVPGPRDLPMLVKPPAHPIDEVVPVLPGMSMPIATPHLQPVPATLPQPAAVPAAPQAAATSATIKMQVPPTAEVWVEKEKLAQAGAERVFQTPPLPPGRMQIINVRAKWVEAGREVEQFRVVGVRSGETARLTFTPAAP